MKQFSFRKTGKQNCPFSLRQMDCMSTVQTNKEFQGSRLADAEAEEAPTLWPPDAKRWLIWKDPDAGKDWGQVEKGVTEDKMVGWHHQLNGHKFHQAPKDSEGQGSLGCCNPWGHKELDTSDWTTGWQNLPPQFQSQKWKQNKAKRESHLTNSRINAKLFLTRYQSYWEILGIQGNTPFLRTLRATEFLQFTQQLHQRV